MAARPRWAWTLLIAVAVLLLLAAGGLHVRVWRWLSSGQTAGPTAAPPAAAGAPPAPQAPPEGPSAPPENQPAPLSMPQPSQREATIVEYALMSLPNWRAKVVRHDDQWRAATVRAVSPDGQVALDLDVVWNEEVGDYEVVRAAPSQRLPGGEASLLPAGLAAAIAGHPVLGKLPAPRLGVVKLTAAEAIVRLSSPRGVWRVYLKRRDERWVIVTAKRLSG
jgi:pyruvate/2-oxoglutarate dehydrogenase complex dihydrolipoamide acyltransferase (E2) component